MRTVQDSLSEYMNVIDVKSAGILVHFHLFLENQLKYLRILCHEVKIQALQQLPREVKSLAHVGIGQNDVHDF